MRKVLPADHPLFDSRDPDCYVRFRSAMIFDSRILESRKALKNMFGFGYDPHSSAKFQEEIDLIMKMSDSVPEGTFIEKYLVNMDQYLSKKAIKKFFGVKSFS